MIHGGGREREEEREEGRAGGKVDGAVRRMNDIKGREGEKKRRKLKYLTRGDEKERLQVLR